ncbi:MAG: hypothetical protein R3E86_07445 [Pseudomonadales bacterium]
MNSISSASNLPLGNAPAARQRPSVTLPAASAQRASDVALAAGSEGPRLRKLSNAGPTGAAAAFTYHHNAATQAQAARGNLIDVYA